MNRKTTRVEKENIIPDPLIMFKTTAPKFLALALRPATERSGGFDSAPQRAGRKSKK
jgi:hypothetical protein